MMLGGVSIVVGIVGAYAGARCSSRVVSTAAIACVALGAIVCVLRLGIAAGLFEACWLAAATATLVTLAGAWCGRQ